MSVSSRNSHDSGSQSQQFYAVQVGYNKFFIDRRYTNLRPCGDGSYGFVASAVDTVTGEKVAIKKIKDAFSDSIDAKRILRELKLLRLFNTHENIITILDIMTTPTNKVTPLRPLAGLGLLSYLSSLTALLCSSSSGTLTTFTS